MKNYQKNVIVISISAIVWSLAEIIFCIWSHNVSLKVGDIEEEVLLAYNVQQCIVYTMVLLVGIIGIVATIKKKSGKNFMVIGGISLLVVIAIPLMTKVPFNFAAIVFSIMIPYWILKMHGNEEK